MIQIEYKIELKWQKIENIPDKKKRVRNVVKKFPIHLV